MTTHRKSLLPTGFLLKKSNGTQNIYPRTQGHRWPVCLLSCFCSLYFSLQKSYGIISNITATGLSEFHHTRRFRQGAYQPGQALLASRLRVQRYGELMPHARKLYGKVWKIVPLPWFLRYEDSKTSETGMKNALFTPKTRSEGFPTRCPHGSDRPQNCTHLIIYIMHGHTRMRT